jgi:hypothetical protein
MAFTLVELLVVVGVTSVLAGILVPALSNVRRRAMSLRNANHMRQITTALSLFANEHQDRYPPTLAYAGVGRKSFYFDVRSMVVAVARAKGEKRSLSSYLIPYLPDYEIFQCPSAPTKCKDLPKVWQEEESWDNDQYRGNYALYWDYIGFLDSQNDGRFSTLFRGARGPGAGKGYSKLLISDSLVYGDSDGEQDRVSPKPNFTSCEWMEDAEDFGNGAESDTTKRAPRWRTGAQPYPERPSVQLRAGFTDGHVETYRSTDALRLRRPSTTDGRVTGIDPFSPTNPGYPGPGEFYIPPSAVPARY